MAFLSVQSHVATGRVGNSVVVFALQRLGIEVWPVHTVLFSNHPGLGPFRGKKRSAADLSEIVLGLEEHGVFSRCEAVIGGYLGSVEIGAILLDAVARVRRVSPEILFVLDPVMGDAEEGLYVAEELIAFYRDAVHVADVLTPNAFELGVLTGCEISGPNDAIDAARPLLGGRTQTVFVTSVPGVAPETIVTLAVGNTGVETVETPKLSIDPKGAGDLFAALATARLLESGDSGAALRSAVASVWSLSEAAIRNPEPAGDLPVVTCQSLLVNPPPLPNVNAAR